MDDLLRARGFEPRALHELPYGATAVEVDPSEAFGAWSALRDAGVLTVALTAWGAPDELLSRFYYDGTEPDAVLAGSRVLPFEDALGVWPSYELDDADVRFLLDETRRDFGDAPAFDEVPATRDAIGFERWLLGWEEQRRPTTEPEPGPHIDWFEPDDAVLLTRLPVSAPEDALAYESFFGAAGAGRHEALIAVVRSWRERFGATLYANWGTMLQFVVDRPPTELDTAFDLAAEQVRVAPCTTLLPGETIRSHARALLGRGTWFLHERP